jgi:nucleoside-diphosphate-sugar epimerase
MPDVAFVTGGSSLVGRALVARLTAEGTRVIALARSAAAADVVRDAGAEPVFGDLTRPEAWEAEAVTASRVFHLGLPRLPLPLRTRAVGRLVRDATAGAAALRAAVGLGRRVTMASTALVFGDCPVAAGDDHPAAPAAMARPAFGAEQALSDPELRVVRLGWVYGEEGILFDLLAGLRSGRFRVVGPGDNRWALISPTDAAAALVAASEGPPGTCTAAEPVAPTQLELIRHVCEVTGLRRPDHMPPAMAALSLGGATAAALRTSMQVRTDRLTALGWGPADDWRRDLPVLAGEGTSTPAQRPPPEG